MALVFRDPPEKSRKEIWAEYEAMAAGLRANPGKSAVVRTFPIDREQAARDLSANIRSARNTAFGPKGAFESSSHIEPVDPKEPEGTQVVNVYACYIGPA